MADDGQNTDDSQKTEDPTPKRLADARKKGQVAQSREVNNWMMIFATTMLVMVFAPGVFSDLSATLKIFFAQAHQLHVDPEGLGYVASQGLGRVAATLFLPVLVLLIAAIAGPFFQVGVLFSPESMKPSLEKISLVKGFKRLFSMRSLAEFAKSFIKLMVIGFVSYMLMKPYFPTIAHFVRLDPVSSLGELQYLILRLLGGILAVTALVAILDYAYQRHEHMKKMRMSKQEIKDEYKQTEGDPQIKARLRELRVAKARQRMMQAVPEADVIITNPTHYSIALKYDPDEMPAPVVVAKGVDEIALRIRELAKEHDVPLFENPPLARALFETVDIDESIPEEHFKAVAEVISYIFQLKNKTVH